MKRITFSIILGSSLFLAPIWECNANPSEPNSVSWIMENLTTSVGHELLVTGTVSSVSANQGVTVTLDKKLSFSFPVPEGYMWIGKDLLPTWNKVIHTTGMRKTIGPAYVRVGEKLRVRGILKKEVGHYILENPNIAGHY